MSDDSSKPQRSPPDTPKPCRACGALMVWASIVKKDGTPGKMPFDNDPSPGGTHALFKKPDGHLRAEYVPAKKRPGQRLRTSHFATCPHADDFRSKGDKKGGGRGA